MYRRYINKFIYLLVKLIFQSSPVGYALKTQGSQGAIGLLKQVHFQATPKLSFGRGGRAQMFREAVADDRSGS